MNTMLISALLITLGLLMIARVLEIGLIYLETYNKESFAKSEKNRELLVSRIIKALGDIR